MSVASAPQGAEMKAVAARRGCGKTTKKQIPRSALGCVLFLSVLFLSVLFLSVLFLSVLFLSVLFLSVLFLSVLFLKVSNGTPEQVGKRL